MKTNPQSLAIGDSVRCLCASIDYQFGKDEIGEIVGFARLSSCHPREAMVRFADGRSDYFWLRDLVEP